MAEELINILQKHNNGGLNKVIERVNDNKRLEKTDIDIIESVIKSSGVVDIDSLLTNIMYLVIQYDIKHLTFPKVETVIEKQEVNKARKTVDWSDVLSYLEIDIKDLDNDTLNLMERFTNFGKIVETAKFIKNSRNPENRIINKISDPNIVIMLLMFSNKKIISSIVSYFRDGEKVDARCLGIAVEAIPAIFMDHTPQNIPGSYQLFKTNYELLKQANIDVRTIIIYKPILMISTKLKDLLNELGEDNNFRKAVIMNASNVLITHEGLFDKNKNTLLQFGVDVKTCKEGEGFHVLANTSLTSTLEKINEMSYDDEVLEKRVNGEALESIRGFCISNNYNESKNKGVQYKRGVA